MEDENNISREYTFILHWLDGKDEEVTGEGISRVAALANAMTRAGYGGGALRALDYWEPKRSQHHAEG